jgi:peptidoglycan/LPS O-acetylase OafA/YrhL
MWPYYLFFATNIGEAKHPFAGAELTILWSLAVEEHFYLVWPFAVRYLNRMSLIRLALVLLAVEPLLRGLFTHSVSTYWVIYVLTPFQLDGLVAGSLLAVLLEEPMWTSRLARVAGPVTLVSFLIFCAASRIPPFDVKANSLIFNMLGYSLVTLVAASFVTYTVLKQQTVTSRILSHPVLAWIGLISYGIYLYHVLIVRATQLVLWRIRFDHMRTMEPVILAATLLLSAGSYYLYEKPLIRWGSRTSKRLAQGSLAVENIVS